MVLRVWFLLCWLALSSVAGSGMAMAHATTSPCTIEAAAALTDATAPVAPALPSLGDGPGDDATPPPAAEWTLAEPVATLPAAAWRALPRAQGTWQRSAHAEAPRGPVLDGLLRPPKHRA
jgi:hypothetical protein